MNAVKAMNLCRKYAKCPKRGSGDLMNGEGSLEVTDDTFKRTCKCGWSVCVDEEDRLINHPDGQLSSDLSSDEIMGMHLDGTLCEQCGKYLGEAVGHPKLCEGCMKTEEDDSLV
jgi:hypothetical protein